MYNSTGSVISKTDLLQVFLKLGIFGFGGPAAHIAMMRDEVVERRKWLSEQEFFDLVGATHLIPGPNSTELAIHIGHRMRGFPGLLIAGSAFILPAFIFVLILAFLYTRFGELPHLTPVLSGIRPVIIAIVILALWKFRETAVRNYREGSIALISLLLIILGFNEIMVLVFAGALMSGAGRFSVAPLIALGAGKISITTTSIFFIFLKIGSVLFGSGYVLLAFLKEEFIDERMWLTSTQLLDAVTVGQVTPGPVFTTATFIGFLLQGYTGAIVATLGIFLPSFFFVALSAPFIPKLRTSKRLSDFLNGVNAASFALMTFVTFELGSKSLINITALAISIVSVMILKFTPLNSTWLILAGGLIGLILN